MNNLHFIRPECLWALIPLLILTLLLWRKHRLRGRDWSSYVDAHLLKHLAVAGQGGARNRFLPLVLFVATFISVIAVAGPAWKKIEIPTFSNAEPTVLILSLAQSMKSTDVKPNRLKRAIHKVRDILAKTAGESRALIIYSDSPFIASPLTDDAQVIEQMLPEISVNLMPVLGARLDLAIDEAVGLLKRGKAPYGRIIALTDSAGDKPKLSDSAVKNAKQAGYSVSVLAIGQKSSAPKNSKAATQKTLGVKQLQKIATLGDGLLVHLSAGDEDVKKVLGKQHHAAKGEETSQHTDDWQDQGFWLLLIPLAICPFLFRKGILFILFITVGAGMMTPKYASAESPGVIWKNLWQTPDQQGQKAFKNGDYKSASRDFKNPAWKASADYKAGNFQEAAKSFIEQKNFHNAGNALAKSGDLDGALEAYDKALKESPDNEDIKANRDLVESLKNKKKPDEDMDKNNGESNDKNNEENNEQENSEENDGESNDQNSEENNEQENSEENDGESNDQNSEENNEQNNTNKNNSDSETPDSKGSEDNENKDKEDKEDKDSDESNGDKNKPDIPENSRAEQGKANNKDDNDLSQQKLPKEGDPDALPKWENNAASETKEEVGEPKEKDNVASTLPVKPIVDQATEQQLRRVPDDPSGLLRHRIHQHYLRQRMGNN